MTDIRRLQAMLDAAKMPAGPLRVEYDGEEVGEWAYRIKDVVNFAEECGDTWPPMEADGIAWVDPRAEYICAALNAMPELLDELARTRHE